MLLQALTVVLCLSQFVNVGGSSSTDTCHDLGCSKGLLDAVVELIKRGSTLSRKCSKETGANIVLDVAVDLVEKAKGGIVPVKKEIKALDCAELLAAGFTKSGNYTIWPRSRINEENPLDVYCDMKTDGGGWTVIQRRGDFGSPKDYFYQDWESYKNGFGDVNKDFWLGNDNIYTLTNQKLYTVRFDLKAFDGDKAYAIYNIFWIEDETRNYTLHIYDYSGNAGDAMENENHFQFSTKDVKNNIKSSLDCGKERKGGWWYNHCAYGNLNGLYLPMEKNNEKSVFWMPFKGYDSLDTTEIKIRPKHYKKMF